MEPSTRALNNAFAKIFGWAAVVAVTQAVIELAELGNEWARRSVFARSLNVFTVVMWAFVASITLLARARHRRRAKAAEA